MEAERRIRRLQSTVEHQSLCIPYYTWDKKCNLCLTEKMTIALPVPKKLSNKRTELVS